MHRSGALGSVEVDLGTTFKTCRLKPLAFSGVNGIFGGTLTVYGIEHLYHLKRWADSDHPPTQLPLLSWTMLRGFSTSNALVAVKAGKDKLLVTHSLI